MTTSIARTFEQVRTDGRMAFMPFITAGDPDMGTTVDLIRELARSGVDLIEIGFPYSDPIADGPVIQASYTRALESKLHVSDIFAGIASVANEPGTPPLVAMVSYAIVWRIGVDAFLAQAKQAGFAGLIVPDLPGDEAAGFFTQVRGAGLDLIQLVAPTTPRERVTSILQSCSGFVYCIAVAGTTGVRDQVATGLLDQLKWLRNETQLPLAVGFGISKPEHLVPLRGLADGAIVGSGLVRHLQDLADGRATRAELLGRTGDLARAMVAATRG